MFFTLGADAFIDERSGIATDSEGRAISGVIREYLEESGALLWETSYRNGKKEGTEKWY